MDEIICKKCGQRLIKVAELSDSEVKDLMYLNKVNESLEHCLKSISEVELDKKLKVCLKRLYAKKAEEVISRREFFSKLTKKYNLPSNYEIVSGIVYVHE